MNILINNYNLKIISNHIRLKFVEKKLYFFNYLKIITINSILSKLDNFKNSSIIELLYYTFLNSGKKSYISNYKKKYKEVDIVSITTLKKQNYNNLLTIWTLFSFPYYKKRDIYLKTYSDLSDNIIFNDFNLNILPFFPNIYFSWLQCINYKIYFEKSYLIRNKLFLVYFNFPF